MQLNFELTGMEEHSYLLARKIWLQNPKVIIKDFPLQWLRVVGEIGPPPFKDSPRMWLLADIIHPSSKAGDRDAHNLQLAHDWGRPWNSVPFDPGYWVLDQALADLVLTTGIKKYGIAFLNKCILGREVEKIDFTLQRVLAG